MESAVSPEHAAHTSTLEAFADTIIPGEKRHQDDRAIAGVSAGGGAVAAGAMALLEMPESGMAPTLDDLAAALDMHAEEYREEHALGVDDSAPAFVTLAYQDRVALVVELTRPGHPEKVLWTGLALFCNMAFDTGAHLHTAEALGAGHPGLLTLGYQPPQEDGVWRFPRFSYGRQLAELHPDTIASGSLA
jgi:enediyne biosynthesis protein E8